MTKYEAKTERIIKISIETNGELVDGNLVLSLDEAKEIKKLLDELLGKEKEIINIPYPITVPTTWPPYPYYPKELEHSE